MALLFSCGAMTDVGVLLQAGGLKLDQGENRCVQNGESPQGSSATVLLEVLI